MQCSAEALEACAPLIADEDDSAPSALRADAENRQRHIECQARHRASVTCLLAIERAGVLKRKVPP